VPISPAGTACGEVSWTSADGGYGRRTFCFVACTATTDSNPCKLRHPKLACAPSTILLTGYTTQLLRVDLDCDRDTLRFVVRGSNPSARDKGFCHLGDRRGCFSGALPGGGGFGPEGGLAELTRRLEQRHADAPAGSYSARLFSEPDLLAAKLREEADELAEARERDHVIEEAADVLFFACAKLQTVGATLADVEAALSRRQRRVRRRSQHEPGAGEAKPPRSAEEQAAQRAPLPLRRVEPQAVAREIAPAVDRETLRQAGAIVDVVANEGSAALRRIAAELGDLEDADAPLLIDRAGLAAARDALPTETRQLLERAAARIASFAEAQRESLQRLDVPVPGGRAGHEVRPVAVAGCYAPGGRFPLPSTVLMTAVTARVAGVERVIVASPRPTNETLAAAAIAGADALLCVGGAQAIAALAHGVGGVPACDVIVGPGNRWVTAAKQLLCGQVGIDMLAGPTELLVIADGDADPELVAADLLAQAEHDVDARPVLISESVALLDAVDGALAVRLERLSTAETAAQALARQGFCVLVEALEESVAIAEQLAPEHLQLSGPRAAALAPRLSRYGGLFSGEGSAEVLGDYAAGPNHTLPTGGTARFRGGLSVFDFLATRTWLRIDEPEAARELYDDAAALGAIEGLAGHREAALERLRSSDPRRSRA
jgi:phosphoribosyl-ATP pyrophosphohydrolase/phosphoribosyl-AMP cyclohydrolase/histidinol dehydrogenase